MAMAAPVALGMSVLGGAMSIAGGFSQAGAYKSQAAQYQQQQRFAALQAKTDEANRLTQLNQAIGTSRAMAAANNVAVADESGSEAALENANRDVVARNISYTQASSIAEQQRLAQAAASDQQAATWSVLGGFMKGATSIYGGVTDYMKVANQGGNGAVLGPLAGSPLVIG
jgi:hypothetical protein